MKDFYNIFESDLKKVEREYINIFEETNDIYEELNSFLSLPSKRIRSVLGILYLKSQGKELSNEIINVLAAGELLHNASLLHDDVIDETQIRRGKTTIANEFNPKISILSGDLLVSVAIKKLININNTQINEIFLNCTEEMSRAEINQFINRNSIPDVELYLSICRGKTSSLFAAILKSVAVLTGLSTEKAQKFGEIFGLVFQFMNDLEPASAETDSKNGIYTIKGIIGIEKTYSLIDNYREEMKEIISEFPESDYKKRLGDLIDRVCLTEKNLKQV